MTEREKVAAKIKALLAKSVENGATEHEAIAAATKAAKLMEEHNLTMTEAEIISEGFEMRSETWESDKATALARKLLSKAVSVFTDTRIWTDPDKSRKFFGLKPDVIFAQFLYDSLTEFVVRRYNAFVEEELAAFAKQYGIPLESAKRRISFEDAMENFIMGVTGRISERLVQHRVHARAKSDSGRDLVPINKFSLVTQALYDQHNIKLASKNYTAKQAPDRDAHSAGYAAGNEAGFSKPVNNGGNVYRLK